MALNDNKNTVTVSGLATVVSGIREWVENSSAAHSAYRVHTLQEWGNVSGRPDAGNYVFDAKYVDNEIKNIYQEIASANSATAEDMEVIAAALVDLDNRVNATSGKADKVTGAIAGHLAALDADGNLIDAGVTSGSFKTKQSTVSVTGSTLKTITALSQDANGVVSATVQDIQTASTSVKGVVQLKNSIDTSESDTTRAVTPKAVKDAIDAAVSNAYHHSGTRTVAQLTSSLLIAANEGNVYNITDSGTTTDLFIEGAGHPIKAGDNVGICKAENTYKFDLLSGFVDLSGYKTKQTAITSTASALQTVQKIQQNENGELTISYQDIQSATSGQKGVVQLATTIGATVSTENNKAATEKAVRDAINALDVTAVTVGASKTLTSISETNGKISATAVDIKIAESQVTNLTSDLGKKADKVTGTFTADDFAALDANGNLKDSGKKAADFATSSQGAKADSAIQGVKLYGAASALTPDSNKVVTIPNAVATGTTGATNGLMTADDKKKLNGIAAGAEVNQNAFSNVKIGSSTIAADGKTDTLEIAVSGNLEISADTANDKVLINLPTMTSNDVNDILALLN